MRALLFAAASATAEHTEIREVAAPVPCAGEVAIDVEYAGINFVDVMARRGDAAYVREWPYAPGREVAGTVRALGDGVVGFSPGQRVAALTDGGGLADVAVARAPLVAAVPDGVHLRDAAAVPAAFTTAMLLLTQAGHFNPGQTVLVHSASGGVGSAVAALVRALGGGTLIGTVGRPDKTDAARAAGYDAVHARDDGWLAAARAAAPSGVDLLLDPLGTGYLNDDLSLMAPGGRIVIFGNAAGTPMGAQPAVAALMGANVSVGGFSITSLSNHAPERVGAAIVGVVDLLAAGALTVAVSELDSLDAVPGAHDNLAAGRVTGKLVVLVTRRQ